MKLSPEAIKRIRLDLGRTQKGLADILGTTPVTVSRWELGNTSPSPIFRRMLTKLHNMNNNPESEEQP